MIVLGFIVVIGLPVAVILYAEFWPERTPDEHSVEVIRRRIEDEDHPDRRR